MNKELFSKSLAQIVNENHSTASVLEKYSLDFCCKGKRSLQKACDEQNLPVELVATEIERATNQQADEVKDLSRLSLSELADHIVSAHHSFTKKELPQIFSYLQKVTSKHGDRHHELYSIFKNFISLRQELEQHMLKEEIILFPRIKDLEKASQHHDQGVVSILTPVQVMQDEHDKVGTLLGEMRHDSNNYVPPADACTTYRLAFASLQALETDLHQHIHLENNVLFPRAVDLFDREVRAVNN